jgi:hypothetical protein
VLGIQHSEPYAGDPRPNDQARAPDAVRLVSAQISYGPEQWDFDLNAPLTALAPTPCVDAGNIAWVDGSYDTYAAAASARLRHLWRSGAQVFVIGGDHGVTIPVIDALDAIGEPVYVVHIDAHLDWREEVGGITRGYSSPLRWASTRPWILGMTQIGMRATGSARRGEVEAARRYGSRILPAVMSPAPGGGSSSMSWGPRGAQGARITIGGPRPAAKPSPQTDLLAHYSFIARSMRNSQYSCSLRSQESVIAARTMQVLPSRSNKAPRSPPPTGAHSYSPITLRRMDPRPIRTD